MTRPMRDGRAPNTPGLGVPDSKIMISALTLWGMLSFFGVSQSAPVRVEIENKIVQPYQQGVSVGVYIDNSIYMSAITLPLEIRSKYPGGGAYISGTLAAGPNPMGRLHNSPIGPGGTFPAGDQRSYSTPSTPNCSGGDSHSFTQAVPEVDFISPDAVRYFAIANLQSPDRDLDPGFDPEGVPSYILTFNVTGTEGSFIIDTCCITAQHISFADNVGNYYPLPNSDPNSGTYYIEFSPGEIEIRDDHLAVWPDCGCLEDPTRFITSLVWSRFR